MKQSDALELVAAGSLIRPRTVGRILRLSLGLACYFALYQLVRSHEIIINHPVSQLPNMIFMAGAAICIVNYVVNIGFGKNWGRWPSIISVAVLALIALANWLLLGTPDRWILGIVYWSWLFYFYMHLGTSFLLASMLATPGCEMRAIPELFGKLSGKPTAEHHCPAAFITKVDEWEAGLKS